MKNALKKAFSFRLRDLANDHLGGPTEHPWVEDSADDFELLNELRRGAVHVGFARHRIHLVVLDGGK